MKKSSVYFLTIITSSVFALNGFAWAQDISVNKVRPKRGTPANHNIFHPKQTNGQFGFNYRKDFLFRGPPYQYERYGLTTIPPTRMAHPVSNPQPQLNAFPKHHQSEVSLTGLSEDWDITYESGLLASTDIATDVAVDDLGNIYVTGYSHNLPHGSDYYTIKYNAQGEKVWGQHSDGGVYNDDYARHVAVDSSGNIYVTGESVGPRGYFTILMIKFNADGEEQWRVRHQPEDGGFQAAYVTDMALSDLGGIYLTGYYHKIIDGNIFTDFLIVKYAEDGRQVWMDQYNAGFSNNSNNTATSLDISSTGDVYAAGILGHWTSEPQVVTLKYTRDGLKKWIRKTPIERADLEDYALLKASPVAGIYVTCSRFGNPNFSVIKYDEDGQERWQASYVIPDDNFWQPQTMTVDDSDNVYVSGWADANSGRHCLTIKYNPAGEQQWQVRYGAPEVEWNFATTAMQTDRLGNLYVGGHTWQSVFILKYNTQGEMVWSSETDQSHTDRGAMALNHDGGVFVAGRSTEHEAVNEEDFLLLKLNSDGTKAWLNTYDGQYDESNIPSDLKFDKDGNIYVLGRSWATGTNSDIVLIKYTPEGELIWSVRYDNENSWDSAVMALDEAGGIYLAGSSFSPAGYYWITLKYDQAGSLLWQDLRETSMNSFPSNLVVSRTGDVYVAGDRFLMNEYGRNFHVLKYNSSGVKQWEKSYNHRENSDDRLSDMAIDNQDNIYVTGTSDYYDDTSRLEYITIKYTPDGEQAWLATVPDGASWYYGVPKLAVDGWGNSYIAGYAWSENNPTYFITVKYDPGGRTVWEESTVHTENLLPFYDMVVGHLGQLYLSRSSLNNNHDLDIITTKYSTDGTKIWQQTLDSGLNNNLRDIEVDREGNFYVTGSTYMNWWNKDSDINTVKYSNDGEKKWSVQYASSGITADEPRKIAVDDAGDVFLLAHISGGTGSTWKLFKYTQTEDDRSMPVVIQEPELMANLPNPFNNQTIISYRLPKPSNVTIRIFNIRGQLTLARDLLEQPAGEHFFYLNATGLASGIYYYQIQAGNFLKTRKMALVR